MVLFVQVNYTQTCTLQHVWSTFVIVTVILRHVRRKDGRDSRLLQPCYLYHFTVIEIWSQCAIWRCWLKMFEPSVGPEIHTSNLPPLRTLQLDVPTYRSIMNTCILTHCCRSWTECHRWGMYPDWTNFVFHCLGLTSVHTKHDVERVLDDRASCNQMENNYGHWSLYLHTL